MPIFYFLVVAGSALIALLFVADATLESGSPAIVTSQRSGLPESQRPDVIQMLTVMPAPAADMTSQAVLTPQPNRRLMLQSIPELLRRGRKTTDPLVR